MSKRVIEPDAKHACGTGNACSVLIAVYQQIVMTRCRFTLQISPEQCKQYYQGYIRCIVAETDEGVRIAFPASELRHHVTQKGVNGRFEIVFDSNRRLVSLKRLLI